MGAVILLEVVSGEYLGTEAWIKRIPELAQEGEENSLRSLSIIQRFVFTHGFQCLNIIFYLI